MHQKNLAKSLNELYTDPAPNTIFPFDLPHEFPLTRSVSTTTDIFSNCSGATGLNASQRSFKALTPQPNKRTTVTLHASNFTNGDFNGIDHKQSMSTAPSRDSLNDIFSTTKGILSSNTVRRYKSKDELFNEFCKKAGQRPKPKDIYYIEQSSYEDAAPENVFVVDNYATLRKNRRNSASNISKVSNLSASNQSLKDGMNNFSNARKSMPMKNIFLTDNFGGSTETGAIFLNNCVNNYLSQSRSNSRDSNLYQSRTLPRDFLKRNVNFAFDDESHTGRRISANGLYTPYNNSITLNVPPIAAPKQFAQSNSLSLTDNDEETINANNGYAASNDPIDDSNFYRKSFDPLTSQNSRKRDAYTGNDEMLTIQWPNAIPGSPSTFSNRSQSQTTNYAQIYPTQRHQTTTSTATNQARQRSQFYSQHFPHPSLRKQQAINSISNNESTSDNDDVNIDNDIQYHNGRTDDADGGSASSGAGSETFGTFDLDRIEIERRKSHASLFEVEHIDFLGGTPV